MDSPGPSPGGALAAVAAATGAAAASLPGSRAPSPGRVERSREGAAAGGEGIDGPAAAAGQPAEATAGLKEEGEEAEGGRIGAGAQAEGDSGGGSGRGSAGAQAGAGGGGEGQEGGEGGEAPEGGPADGASPPKGPPRRRVEVGVVCTPPCGPAAAAHAFNHWCNSYGARGLYALPYLLIHLWPQIGPRLNPRCPPHDGVAPHQQQPAAHHTCRVPSHKPQPPSPVPCKGPKPLLPSMFDPSPHAHTPRCLSGWARRRCRRRSTPPPSW